MSRGGSQCEHASALLPHTWVVGILIRKVGRCRRMSKDYEYLTETSEAFVYAAMIRQTLRGCRGRQ
jgi:putative transposase